MSNELYLELNHPTPEQVQTVIDHFKSIEDQANQTGAFNIDQPRVADYDHSCGTVHCVAGWYAVANRENPRIKRLINAKRCGYSEGARLMAQHLGLVDKLTLEIYFMDNPIIWGNQYGAVMFYERCAYNGLISSSRPMSAIIAHWQDVKKRLEKFHFDRNRIPTSAIDSR